MTKLIYVLIISLVCSLLVGCGSKDMLSGELDESSLDTDTLIADYNNTKVIGDKVSDELISYLISEDKSKDLVFNYLREYVSEDNYIVYSKSIKDFKDKLRGLKIDKNELNEFIESKEMYYFLDDSVGSIEQLILFRVNGVIYKVSLQWYDSLCYDLEIEYPEV